jgi:hypothetical protein
MEGDVISMPSFVNPNRNWNPNPDGRPNQTRQAIRQGGGERPREAAPVREAEPRREPIAGVEETAYASPPVPPAGATEPPPPEREEPRPEAASPLASATTLIEDMVGRLGLESDTLLIIGLILILVNQKADQTLILALAYLLF